MTTLMKASNQWMHRPDDERCSSLEEMHAKACEYSHNAARAVVKTKELRAVVRDNQVILNGATGAEANFTNWSFGQVSQQAKAPPSYLRTLPAALAAECINTGLQSADNDDESALLFHRTPEGLTIRALTSEKYCRIWNSDVTGRLLDLQNRPGSPWQPAPAGYDGSRGLYLGDRNMFAFMVDNERRIFERLPGGGLSRGFFAWNSEVGSDSYGLMTFLYEFICGNHIVWGASDVKEIRIRHVGKADQLATSTMHAALIEYANASAADDELKIERMRTFEIGATKDEILDRLFALRVPQLTRKTIALGYDRAEQHVDWYGSPRTAWGMVNGLTEVARDLGNADERVALERASQKVMSLAF